MRFSERRGGGINPGGSEVVRDGGCPHTIHDVVQNVLHEPREFSLLPIAVGPSDGVDLQVSGGCHCWFGGLTNTWAGNGGVSC